MKTKKKALRIILAVIAVIAIVPILATIGFATEPENNAPEITEVSTWGELLNAVNSDKTYIKLTTNIKDIVPDDELPTKHRLVFDGGKDYVLDLNGNVLMVGNYENEFYTGKFSMIGVSNSSNLEIKNGRIIYENWELYNDRTSKGVVYVEDESTLRATGVDMENTYSGTVVSAAGGANVTLDGGDYTAMSGFAVYLEGQASLTLDGGVRLGTKVGDSFPTIYMDGYGALYSESTGTLTVNYAYFNTGIQIHESQVGAFSTATHELVINGMAQADDIYFSDAGNQFSALQAEKDYYWYKNDSSRALYRIQEPLFANAVSVISYEKKFPIEVINGTATVGGTPVTEAGYGQTVTIVADTPEEGMEFVRWDTSGVSLANYYSASTTFTMCPAPVALAAYYGKESVKSVSVIVDDIIPGQKAYDTEITLAGGVLFGGVEWYEEGYKMDKDDIFKAGKAYDFKILIYPPEDNKFTDNITATVNGGVGTASSQPQFGYVEYTFEATESVGFSVVYDGNSSRLGVGGEIKLDTTLMASQSAFLKSALDAGKVTYQWYKNGEAIEGATDAVYNLTAEDAQGRFYVAVTADGKTNYGYYLNCGSSLYQVYLNATEIIPGGKAPQLAPAMPGITLDPENIYIAEMKNGNPVTEAQTLDKVVLIPGRSYRIVAKLVENGVDVAYQASVNINGELMPLEVDALTQIFYDFDVPAADYDVYYKANGEIGIGVTLTVDVEKMCEESTTFKNAYEAANPTYQTVFYQWCRNGQPIEGATEQSYTVKTTDKNSMINCVVTLVDGKYGVGEQFVISNIITVLNVNIPYPKDGETRITSGISADGAVLSNVMWVHESSGATMQWDDVYVEGEVYEYVIVFQVNDGFNFDYNGNTTADMTIAYIYGEKMENSGTGAGLMYYYGTVTALHKHDYSGAVWAYGNELDGHWQPCITPGCPNPHEELKNYETYHYGDLNATCQTSGNCSVCGAEYYAEHVLESDYEYIDDMKCADLCATPGCDYLSDWSYHMGGVADCQNKAVCEICHTEYGKLGEHFAKAEWTSDGTDHWHECKNCEGQVLQKAAHFGGAATCTDQAICEGCGKKYGSLASHSYTTVNGYKGVDGHARTCACGAHEAPTAHTPDRQAATENDPVKCTACGYIITPALGHVEHTPKAAWVSDGTYHWHECTGCEGQQLNKTAHTGGVATCTEKAICSVCDTVYGEMLEHNYNKYDWQKDESKHWQVCTRCGEIGNEEAHYYGFSYIYKDADVHANGCKCGAYDTPVAHNPDRMDPTAEDPVKCSDCEYIIVPTVGHDHTPKAEWMSDGTYHWNECEGCEGQQLNKGLCAGGTATCTAKATCETCHRGHGDFAAHEPEAEWMSSGNYHWRECKNCDAQQLDRAAHTGGTASCTANAVCSVCNAKYGSILPHNYIFINGYKDDDGHANVCICGAHEAPTAHTGGTATCTEKAACEICSEKYGSLASHSYTNVNGYKGVDGHANTCVCGAHEAPTAHTPDRAEPTENDPVKCTACQYIITPTIGHVHAPKAEWKTDGGYHWHECTGCEGQQLNKAAHADGNGDGKCDTCEYQMETVTPDPDPTPDPTPDPEPTPDPDTEEPKKKLSGGAIAGIVIGSVTTAGVGGFALVWFVIKKKSFADLIGIFKK